MNEHNRSLEEIIESYDPENCHYEANDDTSAPLGWRCPVCGKGLAPQLTVCPCEGSDITLTINHLERVIKRKIDWITMLEGEIVELRTTPHVSECSCVEIGHEYWVTGVPDEPPEV